MLRVIFSPKKMDIRKIKRKWLDITYADRSPWQKLDIYLPPKGDGPFPVIVSIHAGAWMFGDKRDVTNLPLLAGLKRGFALACIDYRLSGEARFPAQIHDCKAAIRYLRANAAAYQLDGNCIVACGGSAGGHLAALLGTSVGIKELEDLSMGNADVPSSVQAVVCWCAPLENFLNIDPELKENGNAKVDHNEEYSPESRLLGTSITDAPEMVRAASPMTYIRSDVPPFFVQHGSADREVPPQQSVQFAAEMERIAGRDRVILEILKGAGHNDGAFGTDENVNKILDFITRQGDK